ncbi:hypothetical protein F750_1605 [Streptomyces sp. PAMC 26508]|nr:hypothetical protein F750_1605 [Streptomyces sp. PAMC 26508]
MHYVVVSPDRLVCDGPYAGSDGDTAFAHESYRPVTFRTSTGAEGAIVRNGELRISGADFRFCGPPAPVSTPPDSRVTPAPGLPLSS